MALQIILQNGFIKVIDTVTSRDYFFNPTHVKLKREYVTDKFRITDGYEVVELGVFSDCLDASGVAFATEAAFLNYISSLTLQNFGIVSSENSTNSILLAGATYTGTAIDVSNLAVLTVSTYSDVASATNGLVMQFSKDKTNWFWDDQYTIKAASGKTFSVQPCAKWFRVKYTNGGTNQTVFQLETTGHANYVKPSSHRISDAIIDDDDAELVKSIMTGKNAAGNFINFGATNGGNFKISLEEIENGISANNKTQLKVSPYIFDENGNYSHILGDTIFSGAIIAITPEHHEIHCGDFYLATHVVDVAGTATINVLVIVPNEVGNPQRLYHLVVEVLCESEGEIRLYEGPTYSNAGTPITSYNKNRNIANTNFLAISHTPTLTGDGTLIDPVHFGSGKAVGGENRSDEWVLRNNTAYLVRFINSVATPNYITIKFKYYVHPGI